LRFWRARRFDVPSDRKAVENRDLGSDPKKKSANLTLGGIPIMSLSKRLLFAMLFAVVAMAEPGSYKAEVDVETSEHDVAALMHPPLPH
jgi:hypothetical protein